MGDWRNGEGKYHYNGYPEEDNLNGDFDWTREVEVKG